MTPKLPLSPSPTPEFVADLKGDVQPACRHCQRATCDPFTLSLPALLELLWQAVGSGRQQHFCVRPEVVTGQKTRVKGTRRQGDKQAAAHPFPRPVLVRCRVSWL